MSFADFPEHRQAIDLLQRSLERGRLGHAYLFLGARLENLEPVARTLAKTLNCDTPARHLPAGPPLDSCDRCPACRKIDGGAHPDVHWLRPESKMRQIRVEPLRELLQAMHLKAVAAPYKVAIIAGADRMNEEAANAFLKTLEEPPPRSVLILLTAEPQRLLETVLSRCLRLTFGGAASQPRGAAQVELLREFTAQVAGARHGLLPRYHVLDLFVRHLAGLKESITLTLEELSPVNRYPDAAPEMKEKWAGELSAGIEAEYRRQRADILNCLHWWLRDVWLLRGGIAGGLLGYPEFEASARTVAGRIAPADALANLEVIEQAQRLLMTNVQEALALEVSLIKLRL